MTSGSLALQNPEFPIGGILYIGFLLSYLITKMDWVSDLGSFIQSVGQSVSKTIFMNLLHEITILRIRNAKLYETQSIFS